MSKKYTWYWKYIQENNEGRHDKTKEKLYKRILSARNRWSKKYEISKKEIDGLIKSALGKKCPYCKEELKADVISLDHIIPRSVGGEDSIENLEIICDRCNRMKGELKKKEYEKLLEQIDTFKRKKARQYIKRKLSYKDF